MSDAPLQVVQTTASTNADMLSAARAGAGEGAWLRAERQTAGRGRLGRAWASEPGNLYASTLVRLRRGDPAAAGLALVAGVAVEEAVATFAPGVPLLLKWPNDVLVSGAKLAGILLEREGDAVVVGIGINLAHHPIGERPTTDLRTLTGAAPDPQIAVEVLAESFARWLGLWRTEGLEPVRRRWLARGPAIGTAIATTGLGGTIEGLFDGLEADGALRLRHADGHVSFVRAGDVQLL